MTTLQRALILRPESHKQRIQHNPGKSKQRGGTDADGGVTKLESVLAAHLQRLYRNQGVLVVQDGRRVCYFCTVCSKWAFTDASLADHLQGKLHKRMMDASPPSVLPSLNPLQLPRTPALGGEGRSTTSTPFVSGVAASKRKRQDSKDSKAQASAAQPESSVVTQTRGSGSSPVASALIALRHERSTLSKGQHKANASIVKGESRQEGSSNSCNFGKAADRTALEGIGLPPWKISGGPVPSVSDKAHPSCSGKTQRKPGKFVSLAPPKKKARLGDLASDDSLDSRVQGFQHDQENAKCLPQLLCLQDLQKDSPLTSPRSTMSVESGKMPCVAHSSFAMESQAGLPCSGESFKSSCGDMAGAGSGNIHEVCPHGASKDERSLVKGHLPPSGSCSNSKSSGHKALSEASILEEPRTQPSSLLGNLELGLKVMPFSVELGRGVGQRGMQCYCSREGCPCGQNEKQTQMPVADSAAEKAREKQERALGGDEMCAEAVRDEKEADETSKTVKSAPKGKQVGGGGKAGDDGEKVIADEHPSEGDPAAEEHKEKQKQKLEQKQGVRKVGRKKRGGGCGVERHCFICGQAMQPGEQVATPWNMRTGQPACSSRNDHGKFHIFHTGCLWDWLLFSAASVRLNSSRALPQGTPAPSLSWKEDGDTASPTEVLPWVRHSSGSCTSSEGEDEIPLASMRTVVKFAKSGGAEGLVPPSSEAGTGLEAVDVAANGSVASVVPPGVEDPQLQLQAKGKDGQDGAKGQLDGAAVMAELFCPECQGTGRRGTHGSLEHPRYRLSQVYEWILALLLARSPSPVPICAPELELPTLGSGSLAVATSARKPLPVHLQFQDPTMQQAVEDASQALSLFQ